MRWRVHISSVAMLGLAACLYWLPPGRYGWYPRCPIFVMTGLECPGCGITRALSALLHGQLALSWHYNPLAILLVPVLAAYFVAGYWRAVRQGRWVAPHVPLPILSGVLALAVLFGVERNLHLVLR